MKKIQKSSTSATTEKLNVKKSFFNSYSTEILILLILGNAILVFFIFYLLKTVVLSQLNSLPPISLSNQSIPFIQDLKNVSITSRAFAVYDPKTHILVADKNSRLRFAPASTAKIMTAIIALENYDPQSVLTVNGENATEGSKMGLFRGEKISVINLLYGMMLPSGNDAAAVLANNYPGGSGEFIKAMNDKAQKLQLENTQFFDPAGYSDSNYTSAFDLARLAAYALDNSTFAEIVKTQQITVRDDSENITHKLQNLNELLKDSNVTGIKTGFTEEAGGVLVTSVSHDDKLYIVVVLKSDDRFADTKNIFSNIISRIQKLNFIH